MNPLVYIFQFLYRIRLWLIVIPSVVAVLVYFLSFNLPKSFTISSTIYTGVISGFNASSDVSQLSINNTLDNIINIIKSETTLKNVSMRLYAENMIYGNPKEDNQYLTAANYRALYAISETPKDVIPLIDTSSVEKTVENLFNYEEPNEKNFVYGLFNWNHRHYCKGALNKIIAKRLGNSDMIELTYTSDDSGIAFNTLRILNDEFVKQYENLRFGETNNVIAYFQAQLDSVSRTLRELEDELTEYNTLKKVINYEEQTKIVAAMSRDIELRYEEILLAYTGSKKILSEMEKRMGENVANIRNNTIYLSKMNTITELSSRIASLEPFVKGVNEEDNRKLESLKKQLEKEEADLKTLFETISSSKYTKEGISTKSYIDEFLAEEIKFKKAEAELKVMKDRRKELDEKYHFYSPVGSTLKRIERNISLTEQSYINILTSLNEARSRQKDLQMTSASIKVINPPIFPINPSSLSRGILTIASFIGCIVFIIAIFVIIEILDRTLRDGIRTKLITSGKVLCAIPAKPNMSFRRYYKEWLETSFKTLGNSIMSYFKPGDTNIINILSICDNQSKRMVVEQLGEYYKELGLRVKVLTYDVDFNTNSREYYTATSIKELYKEEDNDILIVEYPPLEKSSIPTQLLKEANINIAAVRADKVWKDADQINFDKLKENADKSPVSILLTDADEVAVETFTGMLPPYSYLRKLGYKLYQLGLTSKD